MKNKHVKTINNTSQKDEVDEITEYYDKAVKLMAGCGGCMSGKISTEEAERKYKQLKNKLKC